MSNPKNLLPLYRSAIGQPLPTITSEHRRATVADAINHDQQIVELHCKNYDLVNVSKLNPRTVDRITRGMRIFFDSPPCIDVYRRTLREKPEEA